MGSGMVIVFGITLGALAQLSYQAYRAKKRYRELIQEIEKSLSEISVIQQELTVEKDRIKLIARNLHTEALKTQQVTAEVPIRAVRKDPLH